MEENREYLRDGMTSYVLMKKKERERTGEIQSTLQPDKYKREEKYKINRIRGTTYAL